jgi:hypothetical protein
MRLSSPAAINAELYPHRLLRWVARHRVRAAYPSAKHIIRRH